MSVPRGLGKGLLWSLGTVAGLAAILALVVWRVFIPGAREPPYKLVRSWGSTGSGSGQLNDPNGIAVRGQRVYVADSRNHRVEIFNRHGDYLDEIDTGPKGLRPEARPMNVNIDNDKLYVADYWNSVVQVYSLTGKQPMLIETLGTGEDSHKPGQFRSPSGASGFPDGGNIVVADFYNQRVQILSPAGKFIRQIGQTGHKIHVAGGGFNYPIDIAINPHNGHIYVADGYNDRIQEFTPKGGLIRKWGGPFAMNIKGPFNGWFKTITSVDVGPKGNVFVIDEENYRIQKFSGRGRFLTKFGTPPKGAGYTEEAVAVAGDGTVYSVNISTNQVEVWKKPSGAR